MQQPNRPAVRDNIASSRTKSVSGEAASILIIWLLKQAAWYLHEIATRVFSSVHLSHLDSTGTFPEGTRERGGRRQSDERWNRFKGNVRETSAGLTGWSVYGLLFMRAHRYHLELN